MKKHTKEKAVKNRKLILIFFIGLMGPIACNEISATIGPALDTLGE